MTAVRRSGRGHSSATMHTATDTRSPEDIAAETTAAARAMARAAAQSEPATDVRSDLRLVLDVMGVLGATQERLGLPNTQTPLLRRTRMGA